MSTLKRRRETEGGSRSASDSSVVSYFRCTYCGASDRSTAVEYDPFGYPLCPVCGVDFGP